jgi:hypothetical protein
LGIKVNEVTFLDRIDTTWKGETKDTYYFFGRTNYSSEELEGVINLQWEVSDYFCGSYDEVMQKVGQNGTQHFDNVMQMIENQQEMIESYQPHSKNHAVKKRRIIGLGDAKSTGATGLKRVSDFSRAKSAPPGFGVLEEESVEKPTKKFKIKIKQDLDEKKRKKKKKKKKKSKKRRATYWPYWGFSTDSDAGDFGGDGGGGE